jgi:hypothetical protein
MKISRSELPVTLRYAAEEESKATGKDFWKCVSEIIKQDVEGVEDYSPVAVK